MRFKNTKLKFGSAAFGLLAALWFGAVVPAARAQSKIVNWNHAAYDFKDRIGERFEFDCPPNGTTNYSIYGTDVYTFDSPVCVAAVHAGLITRERGGRGWFEIVAGQDSYRGSTRNNITSNSYGRYSSSYRLVRPKESSENPLSNNDKILAKGDPPLTERMFEKTIEYYEAMFQTRFNAGERGRMRAYLIDQWNDKEIRNYAAAMNGGRDKLAALNDDQLEDRRAKIVPQLIADFDKYPNDILGQIIQSVYRRSPRARSSSGSATNQKNDNRAPAKKSSPVADANDADRRADRKGVETLGAPPDEITGAWGRFNILASYADSATGVYAGSTGSSEGYKFFSNGSVEYTSYVELTTAGCKTQTFMLQKGRYTANGDTLTIKFAPTNINYKSCRTAYTKPVAAETDVYKWRLTKEYDTVRLCLSEPDGKENCLRRDETKATK